MGEEIIYQTSNGRFGLILGKEPRMTMNHYCEASFPKETGGVLVGFYTEDHRYAVVKAVSGPSKDAKATETSLIQGTDGIQEWLDAVSQSSGWYYLGEWHSHPNGTPIPSRIDVRQMQEIANFKPTNCPEPVLIIVSGNPSKGWAFHPYVFPQNQKYLILKQKQTCRKPMDES